MGVRLLSALVATSVVAALLSVAAVVAAPAADAAPVDSTLVTYEAGSYVIDMGQVQTIESGLKPYGLIYDLVVNNQIPVDWVIAEGKQKNPDTDATDTSSIDFSANGKDYRGGAFVIEAGFASEAQGIINTWVTENPGLTVDLMPAAFDAPYWETITAWPNAVLDAGKGGIAGAYYEEAGIGEESYRIGLPGDLTNCDDIYIMPHADPEWESHQNLIPFNASGGYIWAACHAVSVLEEVDDPASADPASDMNFLTNTGALHFKSPGHDGGSGGPYDYDVSAGSDPIMQFLGRIDGATENGSEQIYLPNADGWRPTTEILIHQGDHADVAANGQGGLAGGEAVKLAYGRGFGNPDSGLVMYEGGHSHAGGDPDNIAAMRAFLNLHLLAGIENGLKVETSAPESISAGATVDVSAVISGGAHDYDWEWQSSCGGSFAVPSGSAAGDPVNVATTFTAPATAGACSVKLLVSDTCQRVSFGSSATVIAPDIDLSVTIIDDIDPTSPGETLTYTVAAANNSPGDSSGAVVEVVLPPGVTFVSASPDAGTCTQLGGVVTCELGALAGGTTAQILIEVVPDDGFEGTITADAAISGPEPDSVPTNNNDTEDTLVGINGLTLSIVASDEYLYATAPTSVDYTITVGNDGPTSLTNVDVLEDATVCATLAGPFDGGGNLVDPALEPLDPGEQWTYTCSAIPGSDPTIHEVSASADNVILGSVSSGPESVTVGLISPAITIAKTPPTQDAAIGSSSVFNITVTNTGNAPLAPVTVTDALASDCDRVYTELAAGVSETYTCSMPVTEPVGTTGTNSIDVSGTDPLGGVVTANATADYTVIAGLLDVTKTADVTDARPGDPVTFTIVVENVSAVDQTNAVVNDTWPTGLIWESTIIPSNGLVIDDFATDLLSYAGGWVEIDDDDPSDPRNGDVFVADLDTPTVLGCETSSDCALHVAGKGLGVYQPVNLSGATTATIDYSLQIVTVDTGPFQVVGWDSAADGGNGDWVVLDTVALTAPTAMTPQTQLVLDSTTHAAIFDEGAGAQLGFRINPDGNNNDEVLIDDITITWSGSATGGPPPTLVTAADNIDLAIGESIEITLTGTVDPAIDTSISEVTNLVSASTDQQAPMSATATVAIVNPGVTIAKTVDEPIINLGDPVTYTFTVGNTGSGPLDITAVTDADPSCTPTYVSGDSNLDGLLDTNESWMYSCTFAPSDDIIGTAGDVTVTANDELATPVSPATANAEVDVVDSAIGIVTTVDVNTIAPGDSVTYSYAVTTGTGDEPLGNVFVEHPGCTPIALDGGDTNGDGFLDPGETWLFSCSTTHAVDDASDATAIGTDRLDTDVTATDAAPVDVVNPEIALDKHSNDDGIAPGATATYTFTVTTGGGDDPLSNVTISDDSCAVAGTTPTGDTNGDDILDLDETWVYTCTSDPLFGDHTNYALVVAEDSLGGPQTANDSHTVDVVVPSLAVGKTAQDTVVYSNAVVQYEYKVYNNGDVAFTTINIGDDKCPSPAFDSELLGNGDAILDPGESWIYTCSQTLLNDTINIATVDGFEAGVDPINDPATFTQTASEFVSVIEPLVSITYSVDNDTIRPDDAVTYSYSVTNASNSSNVSNSIEITATDSACSPLVYVSGDDGDGLLGHQADGTPETWLYTCSTTLTEDTASTFTVDGTDILGAAIPQETLDLSVDVINPSIDLVVTAGNAADGEIEYIDAAGDVVYSYTVTNDGDDPLTNVVVLDDSGSPVPSCSFASLGAGASESCSVTVNEGASTTHTGSVTADDSLAAEISDTDPADVVLIDATVSLVAVAGNAPDGDVEYVDAIGDVTFTYTVENTGAVDVDSIEVYDTNGTPAVTTDDVLLCTVTGPLASTATGSCTSDISITGDLVQTALVVATPVDATKTPFPDVSDVTNTDDAEVDLVAPAIAVSNSTATPIIAPDDTVTFSYEVTNTGDTELINIVIVDDGGTPGVPGDDVTVCTIAGPLAAGATDDTTCSTADYDIAVDTTHTVSVTATPSDAGVAMPDIDPATGSDTEFINVIDASMSIDTTTAPIIYTGDTATFTYTVTNTGLDPITDVSVADSSCATPAFDSEVSGNADAIFDSAEVWTFTCSDTYTADFSSTATASGLDTLVLPVTSDPDVEPVDVIDPSVSVVTTAGNALDGEIEYIDAAGPVTYTYVVTNDGDDPLTDVSVLDDTGTLVPGCSFATLAVGASETCTLVVNETASTTHTGTANATDSLAGAVTADDPADVVLVSPAVSLVAVAGNAPDGDIEYVDATGPVTFTYAVDNVGDTDVDSIDIFDSNGTPTDLSDDVLLCSIAGQLAPSDPAASCTSDIAITADVLQTAVVVANPVTAAGEDLPDISDVTATDPAQVELVAPAITVANVTATPIINPDDTVTFSYEVINTGDTDLINITIIDDGGTATPVDDITVCTIAGPLAAGATDTITCPTMDYVISADTTHNVTATATPSLGATALPDITGVANADDEFINVINPALAIETSTTTPVIYSGESVTFTYAVTNTGDDPITSLGVSDSQCSTPVFDAEASGDGDALFEPGEVWNFTCTNTYTADFDSVAIASGLDSLLQTEASDDDRLPIDVISPDIDLIVVAGNAADGETEYIDGPGPVTYKYLVTNTGDDPLTGLSILDDTGTPLPGCTITTLAIGEAQLCTVTVNETVDTTHTGSVSALDSRGNAVSDDDPADVDLIDGAVAIVAVAGNAPDGDIEYVDAAGDVTFSYTVTNTGVENLDSINVYDSNGTVGDLSDDVLLCSVAGPLAPLASGSCTSDVAITGDLTQTALVVATPVDATATPFPDVSDVSNTDDAIVDLVAPGVSISDTTATPIVNPGDEVTYTYVIENIGDTDLNTIVVVDDNGTADPADDVTVCSLPGQLAPAGTATCTSLFLINADITQTATVTANPVLADGTDIADVGDVTASDSESVNVINPALAIDTTTAPIIYSGDTATLTYTITNPGDDPISAPTVSDSACVSPSAPVEVTGNGDALVDPGEVWEATCSDTFTADFSSSATVSGLDSLAQSVASDPDVEPVNVIDPSVSVVTTAGNAADGDIEYIDAAGPVTYTYVVTNDGDDPLTDVEVLDTTGTLVPGCTFATLAVGASETCTLVVNETDSTTHTGTANATDSLAGAITADD
ncbi:MAG: DUF11 domain-containing protein, partial [Acidimicrobiales bacterium]|nr:DUF11 domain-containing protein [Acidimicrobiales bacterium]